VDPGVAEVAATTTDDDDDDKSSSTGELNMYSVASSPHVTRGSDASRVSSEDDDDDDEEEEEDDCWTVRAIHATMGSGIVTVRFHRAGVPPSGHSVHVDDSTSSAANDDVGMMICWL
jgi:hypothetical protein